MTRRRPDIIHASSVHPRDDVRIHHRYMAALGSSNLDSLLVAPRPAASGTEDSVATAGRSIDRTGLVGRIARIAEVTWRTIRLRPRIVHVHDPELLLVSPLLRLAGIRIVYDVHEDVVRQIALKTWLPSPVRTVAATVVSMIYRGIRLTVSGVVVVDRRFVGFFSGVPVVVQRNFPLANEFSAQVDREQARADLGVSDDTLVLTSIGSLSPSRAPEKLVDAARLVGAERPVALIFAGREQPTPFLTSYVVEASAGDFTRLLGHVGRAEVSGLLAATDVALCVLPDTDTYRTALPTKLVEYAAANKVVVASNFTVCADFLAEFGVGTLVDPSDTREIADGILSAASMAGDSTGRTPKWEDDFTEVRELYERLLHKGER